jgi:hypothetical protein
VSCGADTHYSLPTIVDLNWIEAAGQLWVINHYSLPTIRDLKRIEAAGEMWGSQHLLFILTYVSVFIVTYVLQSGVQCSHICLSGSIYNLVAKIMSPPKRANIMSHVFQNCKSHYINQINRIVWL